MDITVKPLQERIESAFRRAGDRAFGDEPADLRKQIEASWLREAETEIRECLEVDDAARIWTSVLPRFFKGLCDAVAYERQHGSLKRTRLTDQLTRARDTVNARVWNALQLESLISLVGEDAQLIEIGFRSIVTNKGEFTREQINAAAPFDRVCSAEFRTHSFPSEERIEAAERQETERLAQFAPGVTGISIT